MWSAYNRRNPRPRTMVGTLAAAVVICLFAGELAAVLADFLR